MEIERKPLHHLTSVLAPTIAPLYFQACPFYLALYISFCAASEDKAEIQSKPTLLHQIPEVAIRIEQGLHTHKQINNLKEKKKRKKKKKKKNITENSRVDGVA